MPWLALQSCRDTLVILHCLLLPSGMVPENTGQYTCMYTQNNPRIQIYMWNPKILQNWELDVIKKLPTLIKMIHKYRFKVPNQMASDETLHMPLLRREKQFTISFISFHIPSRAKTHPKDRHSGGKTFYTVLKIVKQRKSLFHYRLHNVIRRAFCGYNYLKSGLEGLVIKPRPRIDNLWYVWSFGRQATASQ